MKKKIGLMMLIIMAIAILTNVSITFAATVCDHDYDFPYYCSICKKYYGTGTCSKCGRTYTRTDTCSQHTCSYSYDYSVSATCTSQGYDVWSCSCGDTWNRNYTSALDHNYVTQSITSTYLKSAATCTSPAVYYYKCSRCTSSSSTLSTPTTYTSGNALEHTDSNGDGSCDTCGYSMLPVPTITLSLSTIRTAPSSSRECTYQYTGDGEVTVTVGSSSIATVTIDRTNSKITVTGVSDGETTLTISAPATSNYAATTATVTIKVATPLLKAEEFADASADDYILVSLLR